MQGLGGVSFGAVFVECLPQSRPVPGTTSSGDKVLKEVTEVNRPLRSIRGRLGLERAGEPWAEQACGAAGQSGVQMGAPGWTLTSPAVCPPTRPHLSGRLPSPVHSSHARLSRNW